MGPETNKTRGSFAWVGKCQLSELSLEGKMDSNVIPLSTFVFKQGSQYF